MSSIHVVALVWTGLTLLTAQYIGAGLAVAGVRPFFAISIILLNSMTPLALMAWQLTRKAGAA